MKAFVLILTLLLIMSVAYIVQDRRESTAEIDGSLRELSASLKDAQTEDDRYSAGFIKALVEARVETVQATISMLDQKRRSLLHRICLKYSVGGAPVRPASREELGKIERDMSDTHQEIERAKLEDDRYGSGLIKGLIEVRLQTEQQTFAALSQEYLLAKYGIPEPNRLGKGGTELPRSHRTTVPDRKGL